MQLLAWACGVATAPPACCRDTGGERDVIPQPAISLRTASNELCRGGGSEANTPGETPVRRRDQGCRGSRRGERRAARPLPPRRLTTTAEGGGVLCPQGAADTRARPHLLPGRSCRRGRGTWRSHLPGAADPRGGAAAPGEEEEEEETWRRPRAGAAAAGAPQVRGCRRLGRGGAARNGGCGRPCAPGRLRAAVGRGRAAGPGGGLLPQQVRGRSAAARARSAPGGEEAFLPSPGVTHREPAEPAGGLSGPGSPARPERPAELCRRGRCVRPVSRREGENSPGPAEVCRPVRAVVPGAPFLVPKPFASRASCAVGRLHRDGANPGRPSRAAEARPVRRGSGPGSGRRAAAREPGRAGQRVSYGTRGCGELLQLRGIPATSS